MRLAKTLMVGVAASVFISWASWAAGPTPEELARLGKDLTPIGAEKAGNKDGTIPEWKGGDPTPPAGWKVGDPRPDPYAADKKLFTINASNVDQYKDRLSPGQIWLIKNKPGYRMDVYPARRTCAYPDWFYKRTIEKAGQTQMDADGWRLAKVVGGVVPFPVPKTGSEVMWNFKLRWTGLGRVEHYSTRFSEKTGSFVDLFQDQWVMSPLANPKIEAAVDVDNLEFEILNIVTAPPSRVDEIILVKNYIDRASGDAWLYYPGQRRVRRSPTFSYDNPVPGYEDLEMIDQYPMYEGAMDRYDWKLDGKVELYVPYNSYKFRARRPDLSEIDGPDYSNRDLMRYELHRVWKVTATIKPGMRHTSPRRVFYVDEDSYQILQEDLYDAQDKLWRIQEGTIWLAWELPACVQQEFNIYDLNTGRFVAENSSQSSPETDWLAGQEGRLGQSKFDPGQLRREGSR